PPAAPPPPPFPPLPPALALPPPPPLAPPPPLPFPSTRQPPAMQIPPAQGALSGFFTVTHCPLPGAQIPASHSAATGHCLAVPLLHTPFSQVSFSVHGSPSSHGFPSSAGEQSFDVMQVPLMHAPPEQGVLSGLFGLEHCPVAGSHCPAMWH